MLYVKINDKRLLINHENCRVRPTYFTIKDKNILWFIPLSSKVKKYQPIIDKKIKKYGNCKSIMMSEIANKKSVILLKNEILENFNTLLAMKKQGINLFFTDIDKIKEKMLDELQ